ncbi:MAG: hypothetical protein KGJ84_13135 [Elusimicrobia bacterium]|nr:hypothetical protein [Elusimicrobiota bacterium]
MKRDIEKLKTDLADVRGTTRRIAMTLIRIEGKFDDMSERMATKDDINSINNRLDDFTADIQSARRDRALQSESYMTHQRRLDDHEARLKRIETPKP